MQNKITQIVFCLFLTTISACYSQETEQTHQVDLLRDSACYATFKDFSQGKIYHDPHNRNLFKSGQKPTSPWTVHASLPNNKNVFRNIKFIRYPKQKPESNAEIWMDGHYSQDIAVYLLESDEWKFVSKKVVGTDISIRDVYLANNGTIWGSNDWSSTKTAENQGALLSQYNENTRRFEPVSSAFNIPLPLKFPQDLAYVRIQVALDSNDVFWFAVDGDALYTFDTSSKIFKKVIDLPLMFTFSMVVTAAGDIYLGNNDRSITDKMGPYKHMDPGSLMRYSNKTGQLTEVVLPNELWPHRGLELYEADNQLWINSVGYLDIQTETWRPLYSDLSVYFSGGVIWGSPHLILRDSYGIYWFRLNYDELNHGLAWYDPVSDTGCMFTDSVATIQEDLQSNLWMVDEGSLYMLKRGSE